MWSIDAIFLDCDGVIVDTEPVHFRSFLEVLTPFGISFDYDTYRAKYIGLDDRDGFSEILREHGISVEPYALEQLISRKNSLLMRYASDVKVFDGVAEFIIKAKQRGIPIAVVSGALRNEVEAFLSSGGLIKYFDLFVTAEDVNKSKPDPEGYTLGIKRMEDLLRKKLNRKRCVAFEDTPAGIEAARHAGLRVVGVAHTFPPHELHDADYVILSFSDLNLFK